VNLIHFMRSKGIVPDTVTYTSAISACEGSWNASAALDLLDMMKVSRAELSSESHGLIESSPLPLPPPLIQSDGAKPNLWTYSATLSACAKGQRLDLAIRVWDVSSGITC